jgi:hypothetical protein
MDIESRVNQLINNGYEFKLEKYISIGFNIFKKEYGLFIGYSIVVGLISMAAGLIPIIGTFAQIVLGGTLNLGYFYVARKIKLGEKATFEDFFKPFNSFGIIAGITLVSGLLTILAFLCLIIPGIYLAVAWTFALPIIYFFQNIGLWDSMEASRRVVSKMWWWFLLLAVCLFFINIVGALCLLIGLLVTIPASHLIMYAAFDDIMKPDEKIDESNNESILLD